MTEISIHALLAESDNNINSSVNAADQISIHALLAESDDASKDVIKTTTNFYPRSPCGERLWADTDYNLSDIISIHALLAESDPQGKGSQLHNRRISIHALLAESDGLRPGTPWTKQYFYPRSPCGERPDGFNQPIPQALISIHALLAESDSKSAQNSGVLLRI